MKIVEFTQAGPLNSSALDWYWYDEKNSELYVEFKSGNRAGYNSVSKQTVDEMLSSDSIGRFFAKRIKFYYPDISSNVEFIQSVPAKVAATFVNNKFANHNFTVTASVSGTVNVDFSAADVEDAIAKFKEMFPALDGFNIKITGVKSK